MREAVIIDDRVSRQDNYLKEDKVKLESIEGLTFSEEFDTDFTKLDQYSLIAIHRTILEERNLLLAFKDYCKKNNKYLVTFSGGVSNDTFYDDYYVELNSITFYNIDRLYAFFNDFCIEDNEVHLLMLVYGSNWKLPYLIEYNHIILQYGDNVPPEIEDRLYDIEDIIGKNIIKDPKRRNQEIELLKNQI